MSKEIKYGGGFHDCEKCGQKVYGSKIHKCEVYKTKVKIEEGFFDKEGNAITRGYVEPTESLIDYKRYYEELHEEYKVLVDKNQQAKKLLKESKEHIDTGGFQSINVLAKILKNKIENFLNKTL